MMPRRVVIAAAMLPWLLACAPAEKGPGITRARGNEPFWAVTFEAQGATFRTPDRPDGIVYRDGRWKREGTEAKWVYQARRERAEGLWISLEVSEAPCTDSMSGESFPWRAVVTFEDKRMEGCAS